MQITLFPVENVDWRNIESENQRPKFGSPYPGVIGRSSSILSFAGLGFCIEDMSPFFADADLKIEDTI